MIHTPSRHSLVAIWSWDLVLILPAGDKHRANTIRNRVSKWTLCQFLTSCYPKSCFLKKNFRIGQYLRAFSIAAYPVWLHTKGYAPSRGSLPAVNWPYLKLTHISLASFLRDVGKENSPRCDAAKGGVPSGAILFAYMNFIEKWNKNEKIFLMPLKMELDPSKW